MKKLTDQQIQAVGTLRAAQLYQERPLLPESMTPPQQGAMLIAHAVTTFHEGYDGYIPCLTAADVGKVLAATSGFDSVTWHLGNKITL